MTTARNPPLCKKYIINIGSYENIRVSPRLTAEKKAMYLYKYIFCLNWKSEGVSYENTL